MSNNLIIIGLGNHTKTKILPALEKLCIPVFGIITSSNRKYYKKIKTFNNLDSVLDKFQITHCIISTTPSEQVKYILRLDTLQIKIFVEKPAFVSKFDFNFVRSSMRQNSFVTEGFMYRYSTGFNHFENYFKNFNNDQYEIYLKFILPNEEGKFSGSFRNMKGMKHSILYDIGSYIFDFLWALELRDFNIDQIDIESFENKILKTISMSINLNNKKFSQKIYVSFGYNSMYKNDLAFISRYNNYKVSPIFWGRKGIININTIESGKENNFEIETKSPLMTLLFNWFNDQNDKIIKDLKNPKRYEFIISKLEKIERKIFDYGK